MALFKRKHEDFCLLLISLLYILPITPAYNNDCNGKSFHCVNSTHFMICVDVGGGVSMTVDNFVIQCPPTTFCQSTNNFECEYLESTTHKEAIEKSEITNDPNFLNVISLDEGSTQIPMLLEDGITSVLPLERYSISSKPSQISDTITKMARPNTVSNIIKKDVMVPNTIRNEFPGSDTVNPLTLDENNRNNRTPYFTESEIDLDRLQNNIPSIVDKNTSSIDDTNTTFSPLEVYFEKNITNIPNITGNILKIEEKKSNSDSSILDNIRSEDIFPKITNTSSKFIPQVDERSNNDKNIPSVNKTKDNIINDNVIVGKEQILDSNSFFLNGTLTKTSSIHSGLENKKGHNVSLYVDVLTDSIKNNVNVSALTELKPPSHFIPSKNIKPEQMPSETSTTRSSIRNVDSKINGTIQNFGNNKDLMTPIEVKNSSDLSTISVNTKPTIVSLNESHTSSNNNSYTEYQLKGITNNSYNIDNLNITSNAKIDVSTSKTGEEYPKNHFMFLNTTLSNNLVDKTELENLQSQNIDLSVNEDINNFENTKDPTPPIKILISSSQPVTPENIKSENKPQDKPKASSKNDTITKLQLENSTNNNENLNSSNTTSNTKMYANQNTKEKQYPENDDLFHNTTLEQKLDNQQSQNIDLSATGVINNTESTKDQTIIGLWNSSAQPSAPENISFEVVPLDNLIDRSDSTIQMPLGNKTNNNENLHFSNKSSNADTDVNTNTAKQQFPNNNYLLNNTTTSNELFINTKLAEKPSQNLNLSINATINNFETTEDKTINELHNSSAQQSASENINSEIVPLDKPIDSSYYESNIKITLENETNNNGNIYSLNTSNANHDVNTYTTEEQFPKNDYFFNNTTIPNELVNTTKLENKQSQNINASIKAAINNYGTTEDTTIIQLRNLSGQPSVTDNIKSEIAPMDKPENSIYYVSTINMPLGNETNYNENVYSSNVSSNANIGANTNATEKQFPKNDYFFNNTTIPNELVNTTKLENKQIQNSSLSFQAAINNYGTIEDTTIIQLRNLSGQPSVTDNIKSEIAPMDKSENSIYYVSTINMPLGNETNDNENVYSSNVSSNANIGANTNATEKQFPKNDYFFNNTTIPNELVNTTKLENKQIQNSSLSFQAAINNYGTIEDTTIIQLRNLSGQPSVTDNIKSEIAPMDKSENSIYYVSTINMPLGNEANDNVNVYSSNVSSNANIGANTKATEEQFPKNDYFFNNTSISNELVNTSKLENKQIQNSNLSIQAAINNYGTTEDTTIIQLRNSSVQSSAPENTNSEILPLGNPIDSSYYVSNITMSLENDTYNNRIINFSNISSNPNIGANTKRTVEQFTNNDYLLNNITTSNNLGNTTKLPDKQSQNLNIGVKAAINNFGNTGDTIINELRNSSALPSVTDSIKSEIAPMDKSEDSIYDVSIINMPLGNETNDNENVYSSNVSSNANFGANTNSTEEPFPKNDYFFNNTTIPNELVNTTKLENKQIQNSNLSIQAAINNYGTTEDTTIIQLRNLSGQLSVTDNIKSEIAPMDKPENSIYYVSTINMPLGNETNDNENVFSLNVSSNANIGANTNKAEEQFPKNDYFFNNTTIPNELVNTTKLENKQIQNSNLSFQAAINNYGTTEDTTVIQLRNLSGQPSVTDNIKSEIAPMDKPENSIYYVSTINMPLGNETNDNENVYSSNVSSNANTGANTKVTEEQFPKNDYLFNNTTTPNGLASASKLENKQSESLNPNVKAAINNYGTTQDTTITELRNPVAQISAPKNMNSKIVPLNKPIDSSYYDSHNKNSLENKIINNSITYFSNTSSNTKIVVNINTTEEQFPKNDYLFNNTTTPNELVSASKLENKESENLNPNVKAAINNYGTTEDTTIIQFRNSFTQPSAPENINSEIVPLDKPIDSSYYDSSIKMENESDYRGNIYSSNSSNANIDANIDTTEEQFPKNYYSINNTTTPNELVNNTKLENMQSRNINLNIKEATYSFGNSEVPNTIELQNLSALLASPENMKSKIMSLDKPKATGNNESDIEKLIENKTIKNKTDHSSNISPNPKFSDANIHNTSEKQYPINDNLFYNTTTANKFTKNTYTETKQSQNIDLSVRGENDNFENTEAATENIKSEFMHLDELKAISNHNSDIEIQMENENVYLSNITSDTKNDANINNTEKQYYKYANLFNDVTIVDELVNNTKLGDQQNHNRDQSIKGAINNFGTTEDPPIIALWNLSAQTSAFDNKKYELLPLEKPEDSSYYDSNIKMRLENETKLNENVHFSNISSNANIEANTNTIEQFSKNDYLFNNTTTPNELVINTKLENKRIQNLNLTIRGQINNFGAIEDPSIIELRNLSSQQSVPDNTKPNIALMDKPEGSRHYDSNIKMRLENGTNNNVNVYFSNISSIVNTYSIEETNTKNDDLFNNTTLSSELVNNTKLEDRRSQNINLSVKGAINHFRTTEDQTIIELRNSSANSTSPENIRTEVIPLVKAESYDNSNNKMEFVNLTNEHTNSSNISSDAKTDANKNTVEEKYPKNEYMFNDITILNELDNDTKLENIQSPNTDVNVKEAINSIGYTENPTIIELKKSSAQLASLENIKLGNVTPDQPKATGNYDKNEKMQIESETNYNKNVHSSNMSSNPKMDVNPNTIEKQYTKKVNLFNNTTIVNEPVINMTMEPKQSPNKDLSVKGVINNFRTIEDTTIIELQNSSAQSDALNYIKSEITHLGLPKATSNNDSGLELQMENENVYFSNISLNTKRDKNINAIENLDFKYAHLFNNSNIVDKLVNNTKLENMQSQNKSLGVNGVINNFRNNDDQTTPIELNNSMAQLSAYENKESNKITIDIPRIINTTSYSIEMQMESETNNNIYNLNNTLNDKINTNVSTTRKHYPQNDKFFFNTPFSRELINNFTKFEKVQSQNVSLSIDGEFDNSGQNDDSIVLMELKNLSAQPNSSQNIKPKPVAPDTAKVMAGKQEDNKIYHNIIISSFNINKNEQIDTKIKTINDPVLTVESTNETDLENIENINKSLSTNGEIEFINKRLPTGSTELRNSSAQSNMSEITKTEIKSLDKNSYSVYIENSTDNIFEIFSLSDTFPAYTDSPQIYNSSQEEQFKDVHEKIQKAVENLNKTFVNINQKIKNSTEVDTSAIYNSEHSNNSVLTSVKNITNETTLNSPNNHLLAKEDWYDGTENGILKNTKNTIQTTISSITSIDNSSTIISNEDYNLRKEDFQSNNKYYSGLTEKITQSTFQKPNFVDNYSIVNNETLVNNTSNDKHFIDGVEIFNSNFDVTPEDDIQSVSNVTIHSIKSQENIISTHENYRIENDQSDIMDRKINKPQISFNLTTLFNNSAKADVNYSGTKFYLNKTREILNNTNYVENSTQSSLQTWSAFDVSPAILDKVEKNINQTNIPTMTKNDIKASPRTYVLLKNSEVVIKETVNSSMAKVKDNVYTDSQNATQSISEVSETLILKGNITTNFSSNLSSSTETTTDVLITTDKSLLATPMSYSINNLNMASAVKPELQIIRKRNNYKNETLFPNTVNRNKTSIETFIKAIAPSSELTNLTRVKRPLEPNINTKRYNSNSSHEIAISSIKELEIKNVKVGNTNDTLKLIEKPITKPYVSRDTNLKKLSPVSSEKNTNVSYAVMSALNNNNSKVDRIQLNNTYDKMDLRDVTTENNYNNVNKNYTTKTDEIRNTGLTLTTSNTSLALKKNESKNFEILKKPSNLGNTRKKPALPNFFCRTNSRGRFADESNCRRFYICLGNRVPVAGLCPENTVFSELRKQCTKNLSHCIRHNQFKCLKEGRFADVWYKNIYYICVKGAHEKFVSFKFQCQNGYRLDKTNVTCNKLIAMSKSVSSSTSTSSKDEDIRTAEKTINTKFEQNKQLKSKSFKCESEGKFRDATNCRRYYVCSKTSKSKLRRKRKKCDSDEIFDGDKNKCVDKDSHECK